MLINQDVTRSSTLISMFIFSPVKKNSRLHAPRWKTCPVQTSLPFSFYLSHIYTPANRHDLYPLSFSLSLSLPLPPSPPRSFNTSVVGGGEKRTGTGSLLRRHIIYPTSRYPTSPIPVMGPLTLYFLFRRRLRRRSREAKKKQLKNRCLTPCLVCGVVMLLFVCVSVCVKGKEGRQIESPRDKKADREIRDKSKLSSFFFVEEEGCVGCRQKDKKGEEKDTSAICPM